MAVRTKVGSTTAIRGPALTYSGDPFAEGLERTMRYEPDAIVAMAGGKVTHFGPVAEVQPQLPHGAQVRHYGKDSLILAGFVDCHVHYSQTQIIGAYGEQLTDWLTRYAYAAEQQFAGEAHARAVAKVFLQECLRAGTTTYLVYMHGAPGSGIKRAMLSTSTVKRERASR